MSSLTTALLVMRASSINISNRAKNCLNYALNLEKSKTGTLYVYFLKCPSIPPSSLIQSSNISLLSTITKVFYSHASQICPSTDLRLLLKSTPLNLHKKLSIILSESNLDLTSLSPQLTNNETIQIINETTTVVNEESIICSDDEFSNGSYNIVALGGTFDRLHNGHRVLLTEAVIRAKNQIIIGITHPSMLSNKVLSELIESWDCRSRVVSDFVTDIFPSISLRILPLTDPYGPTVEESDINGLIVSDETRRGGDKINEIRKTKGFCQLAIHSISLFRDEGRESENEETKISSSSGRMRILGTRLSPPKREPCLPYIIGLTGGIASGKTKIAQYLSQSLKIPVIDCDKLGHLAYLPSTPCYSKIVEIFGNGIVSENGEINRKALGEKVFKNETEMKKLTDVVWPEIHRLVVEKINELSGERIIVIEAAVLVEAQWNIALCHDIWVTFIPRDEGVRRVVSRDGLSSEAAESRVDSQMKNELKINYATFIFSSLWDVEFTRAQVHKALNDIQLIINNIN